MSHEESGQIEVDLPSSAADPDRLRARPLQQVKFESGDFIEDSVFDIGSYFYMPESMEPTVMLPDEIKHRNVESYSSVAKSAMTPRTHVREVDPRVEAMISLTAIAQQRCGMLAGFVYFEIVRQTDHSAKKFTAAPGLYPLLLNVTFCLAVMTIASAVLIRAFMRRIVMAEWQKYLDRMHFPLNFTQFAYTAAAGTYLLALALVGFYYYPVTMDEIRNFSNHATNLFPGVVCLSIFIPVALVALGFSVWLQCIVLRARHLDARGKLTEETWEHDHAAAEGTRGLCSSIAKRGVFLLGFVFTAVPRFVLLTPNFFEKLDPSAFETTTNTLWLFCNRLYWIFVCSGSGILALAVICCTSMEMQMVRVPKHWQLFMHAKLLWAIHLCSRMVAFGTVLMQITAMLVGFGNSRKCDEKTLDENGNYVHSNCYARSMAYIPAGVCFISVLVTVYYLRSLRQAGIQTRLSVTCLASSAKGQQDDQEVTLTLVESLSTKAAIFSGYVFYSMVTFDKEILGAPVLGAWNRGVNGYTTAFIFFISSAFGAGTIVVVVASEARIASQAAGLGLAGANSILSYRLRVVSRHLTFLTSVSYYFFMLSFSLVSWAHNTPPRPELTVICFIGVFVIGWGESEIRKAYNNARKYSGSVESLGHWIDSYGCRHKAVCSRTKSQLSVLAPRALLFLSASFNGGAFIYRPEAHYAAAFATGCAVMFVSSMAVILWESSINDRFTRFSKHEAQREKFARDINIVLRQVWSMYGLIILAFLLCILVLGPMKTWSYNITKTLVCVTGSVTTKYAENNVTLFAGNGSDQALPVCTWISTVGHEHQSNLSNQYGWMCLLGGILGLLLFFATNSVAQDRARGAIQQVRSGHERVVDPFEHVKEDADAQTASATLQVGYTFYELLFVVIEYDHNWLPFSIYFMFSILACVTGLIVVTVGSSVSFWMDDLPNAKTKNQYASDIRALVAMCFNSYLCSIVCWLIAMGAMSGVKTPSFYYISIVTASMALVYIFIVLHAAKRSCRGLTQAAAKTKWAARREMRKSVAHRMKDVVAGLVPDAGTASIYTVEMPSMMS